MNLMMSRYSIYYSISPMEQFEIYGYVNNVNNVVFYLLIAALAITVNRVTFNVGLLVGNLWTVLNESLYRTLLEMSTDYIGKTDGLLYFGLIYSIFHVVLLANLIGLVPYSSTPTVEIVITLSVAFTLLIGILLVGFLRHRLLLLAAFLPAGTPLGLIPLMILLELLAYCTRTLSLGLRLAVNMITGHIVAKVSVGFIYGVGIALASSLSGAVDISSAFVAIVKLHAFPLVILLLTLFLGLEVLIAYLQAYIFTFITSITIKDMTKLQYFSPQHQHLIPRLFYYFRYGFDPIPNYASLFIMPVF
jgi:F-type H+-transporting ATPase subunit a